MKAQISFVTMSYNAQKHIRATAQSILNQTMSNIQWVVLDNGCTDGTGKLLEEYATNDSRVKLLKNERNNVIFPNEVHAVKSWVDLLDYCKGECIAFLDSDDTYDLTFAEKTLAFLQKHDLDIVACGSEFVSSQTGKPMGKSYSVPDDIIISSNDFAKHFSTYLQFMWTIWGKLYRSSIFKQCGFTNARKAIHAADTMFATEVFTHAKRIGILGGTLHKYYIQPKSVRNTFNHKRVSSDPMAFEGYLEFLNAHNAMTKKNLDTILGAHLNSVKNTIIVALNSDIEPLSKLVAVRDSFTHKYAQEAFYSPAMPESARVNLQNIIVDEIMKLAKSGGSELYEIVADILSALPPQRDYVHFLRSRGWSDYEMLPLLLEIANKFEGKPEQEGISASICKLLRRYPILKDLCLSLVSRFCAPICMIMQENYANALDGFIKISEDVEICDDDVEAYFILGQNLGAAAEDMGVYVYFKKLWLSHLLDCSRLNEAKAELDEFLELFPEDEDFLALKVRLDSPT